MIRIGLYIALATILVAAATAGYKAIYNAGYNARSVEITDDAIVEQNRAIARGIQDWIDTQEAAEPIIVVEEKIVEKIRVVEKEIPKVVERVRFECRDLGTEYVGLLSAQVAASNASEVSGADVAADLVEGVSGTQ